MAAPTRDAKIQRLRRGASHAARAAMSTAAIEVEGLTKSFGGKRAVNHLSMTVQRGEIFGFLGPNGSGKTTSIRMLCGLLTPDSGRGTCVGHDILTERDTIKREVGYMTQRFSYYDDLSIRENLEFVLRMYEMDRREPRVDEALKRLGLVERQHQLAGTLSGGWKQRMALAACLLHEPQLLLLDEPTAGVDPNARREFWEEIHRLAVSGVTVLVSTHYMDEAERCHRLAYIADGELLAQGTPDELIAGSGLSSWTVTGGDSGSSPGLHTLADELRRLPVVEHLVPIGNVLHLSGSDAAALDRALAPFQARPGMRWERSAPRLEDVFIQMLRRSRGRDS